MRYTIPRRVGKSEHPQEFACDLYITDDDKHNAKMLEALLHNVFNSGKLEKDDTLSLRPVRLRMKAGRDIQGNEEIKEEDVEVIK